MPVSRAPYIQEADSLAGEIVGILSHQRVDERRLLDFAGEDPYPTVFPVIQAVVRGTLDPETDRTREIGDRFAELGARARSRLPDAADVMIVCGRSLYTTERYVARARPDLLPHEGWVRHWATMSQIGARAALHGHRHPSPEGESMPSVHDSRLPSIFGLRVPEPVRGNLSDVEVVRDASRRMDAGEHAVIATDHGGTILYWNYLATKMYGWPSAEALGRNIVDVTPVTQASAEAQAIMQQLVSGRPWTGAFDVRTRAGNPLRAYVTDIPVRRDERVVGIVGLSAAL